MRTALLSVIGICMALCAQAQPAAPLTPQQVDTERNRIQMARHEMQSRFGREEADCYQRFAVNDCLRGVQVRRRTSLDALRREENALNDAERKTRAALKIK